MSEVLEQKTSEEIAIAEESTITAETSNNETTEKTSNTGIIETESSDIIEVNSIEAKKKNKKPLIIAIASFIVVAVIVGVILLIVFNSKSEEAKRVDSLIANIGTVTLDSNGKITEAEKEAKSLKKEDYEQLDNVEQLQEARKTYDNLVLQEKADKIISQINDIGEVTLDSKTKIHSARDAYDEAEESVKKLVTNYDTLTSAEVKYKEVLQASFAKEAERVIALINNIGTVTKDSEKKINEAEEAYEALSSGAQNKVTNYETLTKAKSKLSSIKKQAVKDTMDSSLSKLTKRYDEVSGVTWYNSPAQPKYINDRTYLLPCIGVIDNNAYLFLRAVYTGDDWIFFNKLNILADGKRFTKECSISDIERDNKNKDVWEVYAAQANESDLVWLKDVANASNATIRFSGKYNYDLNLSDSDKQAIKEVLEAYEAVFNYYLYDAQELFNNTFN